MTPFSFTCGLCKLASRMMEIGSVPALQRLASGRPESGSDRDRSRFDRGRPSSGPAMGWRRWAGRGPNPDVALPPGFVGALSLCPPTFVELIPKDGSRGAEGLSLRCCGMSR
jgi:hypothetical protein